MGKLRKRINEIKKYVLRNKRVVIFNLVRAVIGIAALIAVIMLVRHNFFENNDGKKAAEPEQTEQAAESEETKEAEEEIFIAAEMGAMEDADDPQSQAAETDGAAVDLVVRNAYETSGRTYGIDVSKYQGTIDWAAVASSGVEFAMIRAGYRTQSTGVIYEDPCARYNLQEAQKNGIKTGVYFFSTAVNETEAREEAAWTANFIARYKITYPVAYNCEGFRSETSRQYALTREERTNLAGVFLDYVQAKGYTGMFYAAKSELEGNADWDTDVLESRFKVWVSQYPGTAYEATDKSSYSGTHAMWQYTNKGTVSGISKTVDVNVAYFGYSQEAEAKDSSAPESVEADPEVGINFKEVSETVTAKSRTNLRSVPDSANPDTVVMILNNGDTAERTGIGSNGWSRVICNGKTLYAVSSYLTADLSYKTPAASGTASVTYEPVNEQVTAKIETNLRSKAGSEYTDTIVTVLHNGEMAVRTGIGSNGWSMLEYNGQTLYALTSYLTTDLSVQSQPAETEPTPGSPETGNEEMKTKFTDVNERVTAKSMANLRSLPGAEREDTIVAQLGNGDIVTRTGISDNGWSRLDYNGQTVYAVTSYLKLAE